MSTLSLTRFRTCTKCGVLYPATLQFFSKNDRGKYGLQAACRECERIRNRAWLAANKERRKQYKAKWEAENQERRAKRHKEWARENNEQRTVKRRAWLRANPKLESSWPSSSQEARRMRQQLRRSRMRNAGINDLTFEQVWQMVEDQQYCCAYCDQPFYGEFEIDHMIPISRGGAHTWSNVAVACMPCNRSKNAKTPLQFLRVLGYDVVEEALAAALDVKSRRLYGE